MSVALPPEAPAAPAAPEPPPPAAPSYVPPPVDAVPPPAGPSRGALGGLILIALGVVALMAAWFPGRGAWLFLGLGAAFLIARVLTGRYGYAVPAGILLGFGSFIWFTETGVLNGPAAGGMFFIFLGLGFLASYAIAARPSAVWPISPGLVLIGFGTFVQATTFGAPLGQFWWLAQYWPLALVAVGVWLLVRDRIPTEARTPVAVVGASALILLGLLVAAAGMANVSSGYVRGPMPMPWPMFQELTASGQPPYVDTIALSAPVSSIDSIRLVNTSGSTVLRATEGSEVRIQATRHFWTVGNPPEVRLLPTNGALTIEATPVSFGPAGTPSYVDYLIETPSRVGADIRAASGSIDIRGLNGAVRMDTASGDIEARDLSGSTFATTASGAIRMVNVSGDTRVSSVSGSISTAGADRLAEVRSISGTINLSGQFATAAQISSVSGEIVVRFTPAAAVHVDAASFSGDVTASELTMTGQGTGPHSITGDVSGGGPLVSVRTTSGGIKLLRGS